MSAATSPALIDPQEPQIGPDITGRVLAVAAELRRRGLRPGDRVLVKGHNSASLVVCLLALMHADASLVVVDPQQLLEETASAAHVAGAVVALTDEVAPDSGAIPPTWDIAEIVAAAGTVRPPGGLDFADWLQRADAAVLWSSGTTGPAKGVVKPGPALRDNTDRTRAALGYRPDDVLAPWLSFSHQYGLSLLLLWWFSGCTLVVAPYRRLDSAVDTAVRYGATVLDATPSTYHLLAGMLARRPQLRELLTSVRMWCVGGAPLPAPLAASLREATGRPLLDGYGSTELGNVALATVDNPVGCGRPLPGVRVRIADGNGQPVPAGVVGEVLVRSPGMMAGYLTADGFRPSAEGEWYRTEDIGLLDAEGNLHVHGRRQAVHRNGYTLYPEGLERRAEACGAPVKVLASENGRRGANLTFVVADPAGRTPHYWRDRLTAVLAAYEHPNAVRVLAQFPVNNNGKVDDAALRAQLAI
ncbi:class I adenylate-forming enzyme family protein [Krasilnikovia sp. M28-CT-15]|uniref:class I adenylate-forming enzyme family protein n=1 Tax=Krasilnikovia sp. M28-CT-15 TaxID=3373540 RepID=UPI003876BD32